MGSVIYSQVNSYEYLELLQLSTPVAIEVLPCTDIAIDNLGIEQKAVGDVFKVSLKELRQVKGVGKIQSRRI